MASYRFPYTNFHDINLDWILQQITELKTYVTDQIDDVIEKQVELILADAIIQGYYDANTETLVIKFVMNPEEQGGN